MSDKVTMLVGFHADVNVTFDKYTRTLSVELAEPVPTERAFIVLDDAPAMVRLAGILRAVADDLAEAAGKDRLDGALAYLGSMLDGMSCEDVMVAAAEAVNAYTDCGSLPLPISP